MKNTNHKKILRIITALVLLATIVIVGAVLVVHHRKSTQPLIQARQPISKNKIDYQPASKADNADTETRKDSNTVASTTSPKIDSSLNITITRVNADASSRHVTIGTIIDGATSGTCIAVFSRSGNTDISVSDKITLISNYYACETFSVPFSSFPTNGTWRVSLRVTTQNGEKAQPWPNDIIINNN